MIVTGVDVVREWVGDALGVAAPEVRPLDAMGLSREMWSVAGTWADGRALDGILKRDTGRGPLSGTMFTPGREAAAMRAVGSTDVAVPAVLAISDDAGMFLMERLIHRAGRAPRNRQEYPMNGTVPSPKGGRSWR